jgi:acetylglutamate kinase
LQDQFERARVLAEALPYIQRFHGATFVIKYGGHAMLDEQLCEGFAQDVVLLEAVGIKPVVVHGGGPQINQLIDRLGLKSSFVRGMRVTDEATMEAVEMVLQKINKEIVALIARQGGRAVGISGKDADLLIARKLLMKEAGQAEAVDIGLVGEVTEVNPAVLGTLQAAGFIPVVAPVGHARDGQTYNINADVAAGEIAGAVKASKLILLTDVEGVKDKDGALISILEAERARRMIGENSIGEGMIPKVKCCMEALAAGVGTAHVIDGRVRHALLLEIFTDSGVGTQVVQHRAEAQIKTRPGGSTGRPRNDAPGGRR